ncbi:MAG: tetratricopeptide repeat protein, partial [Acidobacteriota bacterium]
LVEDQDLETARRIARLLAMDVEVGRAVRLPDALRGSPDGEIRLVARGGQLQIRLHLDERPRSREISRRLAACLELVLSNEEAEGRKPAEPSEKTGEESPLQRLEKLQRGPPSPKALYDMIDLTVPLEAGPAPLADVYRRIDGTLRTFVRQARGPEGVVAVLRRLARLRGAGRAKARALAAWDKDYRQKLVGAARDIEPGIDREALPEQGVFRLELSQDRVLLQRSFFDGDNLLHFHVLLETDGSGLNGLWAAPEAGIPAGGKLSAAGTIVFFEKDDGCGGLRLYGDGGELRYEGCSARLLGDAIVEEKEALVDTNAPAAGKAELPLYYRRAQIDPGGPAVFESPLESGLRLFKEGRYAEAAFAFEKAAEAIDPVAPYDEVDLRYNRARCLEEQGKVREALALFRSIGDATYQPLVEERLGIVEGAARR